MSAQPPAPDPPSSSFCSNCGAPVARDARACPQCGTRLRSRSRGWLVAVALVAVAAAGVGVALAVSDDNGGKTGSTAHSASTAAKQPSTTTNSISVNVKQPTTTVTQPPA